MTQLWHEDMDLYSERSAARSVTGTVAGAWSYASGAEVPPPRMSRLPATAAKRQEHVYSAPFFEFHNALDIPVFIRIATHPEHGKARPFSGGGAANRPVPQTRTMGPGTSTSVTLARGTTSAYVSATCRNPRNKHYPLVIKEDQIVSSLDVVTLG